MIRLVLLLLALALAPSASAGLKSDIQARGFVQCGVTTGVAGFSLPDSRGVYTGLDVDICKAVAAAILGKAESVKFVPLSAQQRFTAIQSGEVDILAARATWTLTREAALGLNFGPVVYYDGQAVMVHRKLGVTSAKQLDGASICVQPGTTSELNITDYFTSNRIKYKPVVVEGRDQVEAAYFSGRCDAFTTDESSLAATRAAKASDIAEHVILPEIISKEPLAPAVRKGDDEFIGILKWTVYALIEAEERGITRANVRDMASSEDPNIRRLLGTTPGNGKALGLDEGWAVNVIEQVGNYGEVFERHLGPATPLKLERGLNRLWKQGGLIYAPPMR